MANTSFTRRNFITSMATAAAAVSLPQVASATSSENSDTEDYLSRKRTNAGPIKILCTQNLAAKEIEQIRAAGKNINLITTRDNGEINNNIADAEVVLGSINDSLFAQAKALQWMQTFAAGVENMSKE